MLVIRLEAEEHNHVGPIITAAILFEPLVRPKIAVRPLAGKNAFNPDLTLGNHLWVVENVTKFNVTLQPIRQFLPAVFAFAIFAEPGVIVLLQPGADFTEVTAETIALAAQHFEQPAV